MLPNVLVAIISTCLVSGWWIFCMAIVYNGTDIKLQNKNRVAFLLKLKENLPCILHEHIFIRWLGICYENSQVFWWLKPRKNTTNDTNCKVSSIKWKDSPGNSLHIAIIKPSLFCVKIVWHLLAYSKCCSYSLKSIIELDSFIKPCINIRY